MGKDEIRVILGTAGRRGKVEIQNRPINSVFSNLRGWCRCLLSKQSLVPGGEFLFMTDHEEYFEWGVKRIKASQLFDIQPWDEGSFFYPKTDFQIQWEAEGKSMNRIRCVKSLNA